MTKRITKGQRVHYRDPLDRRTDLIGVVVHVEYPLCWVRPSEARRHAGDVAESKLHGLDIVPVEEVHVRGCFEKGRDRRQDIEPARRDLVALSEGPSDAEVARVKAERRPRYPR